MVVGILVLAGGAFYTALVVVTQVDHIFFPDSEIRLGGGLKILPGIDTEGTSGISGGDAGGRRINILVMGLDKRPSDGELPSRTDTMFVMTVDPVTDTARGLAMPRDLWVEIPLDDEADAGFFSQRINAAYAYGENSGLDGGGIGTVERTVERLLDIEIDHYVMIDFDGFREIVNLMGGIEVEVPEPGVNDPFYSETERLGDFYPCVFEPGTYHMDGSQALCYSRVRNTSNDLDRILRQQRVMVAMIEKASELSFLDSPEALVNLWKNYKNTIKTDISDTQVLGYARLAAAIDQDSLSFLTLGAVATPWTTPEGAQVLLPSEEGVRQLVEAFISDSRLTQEAALIEVQNGTGVEGKAEDATLYLASLGIPEESLTAANAASPAVTTEIVVFGAKEYTANRIAGWLGVSTEQVRQSTPADEALRTSQADILIILGDDAEIESVQAE
jgi:LCP family protein required for cell wall assembly